MKLSEQEKASNRAAFRAMNIGQKAEYIFAYYKLPLVLLLIAVVALWSVGYRFFTHRDPLLYSAYCNVVPTDSVDAKLSSDFVSFHGDNPRKSEVVCYHDLYVSRDDSQQNHQYAYASRLKLMAAIDAEQLDVVFMNQEAYDLLSGSGYLLDLAEVCAADRELRKTWKPYLVSNTVILSDNSVEVELNEADEYAAETIEVTNALDVSEAPLLATFASEESLYVGIIANTPRLETALAWLNYVLTSA